MFSELGYMNNFIEHGYYTPSMGRALFCRGGNVIPRALWKNKPLVGVDYATCAGFCRRAGSLAEEVGSPLVLLQV